MLALPSLHHQNSLPLLPTQPTKQPELRRSYSYPRLSPPAFRTYDTPPQPISGANAYKITQISVDNSDNNTALHNAVSPSFSRIAVKGGNREHRAFTYVDTPVTSPQLTSTHLPASYQTSTDPNLPVLIQQQSSNDNLHGQPTLQGSRFAARSRADSTQSVQSPALRSRPPLAKSGRKSSRAATTFLRQSSFVSQNDDTRSTSGERRFGTVFTAQPHRNSSASSPNVTPAVQPRKLGLQRAPTYGPNASGNTLQAQAPVLPHANSTPTESRNGHNRNQSFFLDIDELQRSSSGTPTEVQSPSGLRQRKLSRGVSSNLAADSQPYIPTEKPSIFGSARGMAFLQRADDTENTDANAISLFSRARRGAHIDEIEQQLPQVDNIINPFSKSDTREFIKELGAALFAVGLPLHMVEFYVTLGAHRLGEQVQTFSVTTAMWLRFYDEEFCRLVAPGSVGLSLGKMTDVSAVTEDLLSGLVGPKDGLARIHEIVACGSHWPDLYKIPCLMLLSCAGAVAFGGGGAEMLVALVSGLLLGIIQYMSPGHVTLTRGLDLVSAVVATVVAVITNAYIQPIYIFPAVFGGIFWSIPGLRITLAMNDLSMGNTVTGVAKLMSGIITIIQLGVGIIAGLDLNKVIGATLVYTAPTQILSYGYIYGAVVICSFPTMILLDAKPTHFVQLVIGFVGGFAVSSFSAAYIGSEFGTWLAAFAIGVVGNIYGRLTVNPAIEMWLFSIIMLVPGSIGVKSILSTDNQDAITLFTQMIAVAVAIVTGLFTSNFAIPPKRAI